MTEKVLLWALKEEPAGLHPYPHAGLLFVISSNHPLKCLFLALSKGLNFFCLS